MTTCRFFMHVLSTAINVPTRWPIGLLTVSNILLRVAMKLKYTLFYSILLMESANILGRKNVSLDRGATFMHPCNYCYQHYVTSGPMRGLIAPYGTEPHTSGHGNSMTESAQWGQFSKNRMGKGQTNKIRRDIATTRPNRPSGPILWKKTEKSVTTLHLGPPPPLV